VAVLKEVRSIGEVVFVDRGESDKVPESVRSQLSGSIPVVVIVDPKAEKVYGRYDHAILKTRDFNSIFRQAKKELREDLKNAGATTAGPASAADSETPASGTTGKAAGPTRYADLPFETWESLQGTTIEAKVEDIRGDEVTLRTRDGRRITLKQIQLSSPSLKRLREISG
jgi:hypothetical protein